MLDSIPGITRNYVELPTAVKQGALDVVTPVFRELTGRDPTTVRAFLEANRAALG